MTRLRCDPVRFSTTDNKETDTMSTVQWQETILHEGTEEERDMAFLAFKENPNGHHFVFGGARQDNAPAPAKKAKKGSDKPSQAERDAAAKERVANLNKSMQEARDRRAAGKGGTPSSRKPATASSPKGELAEADHAIKAFMGHTK